MTFPPKIGVSDTLEPRAILTGVEIDFNLHCKIPFGYYDQAYKKAGHEMNDHIVGAIYIGPTHNLQGR